MCDIFTPSLLPEFLCITGLVGISVCQRGRLVGVREKQYARQNRGYRTTAAFFFFFSPKENKIKPEIQIDFVVKLLWHCYLTYYLYIISECEIGIWQYSFHTQ